MKERAMVTLKAGKLLELAWAALVTHAKEPYNKKAREARYSVLRRYIPC